MEEMVDHRGLGKLGFRPLIVHAHDMDPVDLRKRNPSSGLVCLQLGAIHWLSSAPPFTWSVCDLSRLGGGGREVTSIVILLSAIVKHIIHCLKVQCESRI
ncbi:hypothetical protein Dimus_034806 [Dionaea muscipula]